MCRLRMLEDKVNHVITRLDHALPSQLGRQQASSPSPSASRGSSRNRQDLPAAPMQVISDLAAEVDESSSMRSRINELVTSTGDLITQGVLSYQEAITLVSIFQEHYGRWVGMVDLPTLNMLEHIRKSELLFSACCLIAVRHTTQEHAERLAPTLFEIAKSRLTAALLHAPQQLEFFQAALVLCMWSTTVGQTPLSIDSWLLSGFALQHCLTTSLFDALLQGSGSSVTSSSGVPSSSSGRGTASLLTRWSVWNHLCLVHLQ
jgi:hypothetical protein